MATMELSFDFHGNQPVTMGTPGEYIVISNTKEILLDEISPALDNGLASTFGTNISVNISAEMGNITELYVEYYQV